MNKSPTMMCLMRTDKSGKEYIITVKSGQCPLSFAHRQSLSGSIPLPPISLSKSMLSQFCSLRASCEVGEDRWVSCLTARVTTEACCCAD